MSVDAVCFDLDDTLFDYHDYARAGLDAAADYVETQTGERLHDDLHEIYFDEGVTEGTFDHLIERHDLDVDVTALVDTFHDAEAPLTPYAETTSVLSVLGVYDLGLITDGRGGHAKLDRLDLRPYFDTVVVTPTMDSSKHEPEVFHRALSDLSCDAEATVYVGDDPRVDFRVANELGMTTVRLRRGRYTDLDPETEADEPDHEIDRLADLPALVERTAHAQVQ